jgi:hypothetical protein
MTLTSMAMDRLRRVDESAMPDSCTLSRTAPGTPNPDGSGTDGTVSTVAVSCRFVSGAGLEAVVAGRLAQEADAVLYVPLATDVRVTDTVTVAGDVYQIIDVSSGSYATSIMLTLKLVQ